MNGTRTLEYKYDFMSRRVEKKVIDSGSTSKYLRFVYDAYRLIEELHASNDNAIKKKFVWNDENELAVDAYRGAYASTAVAEIAKDRVQDAAIKNTAKAVKSDGNLSNQSNTDMLMDSLLGGDDTFEGLTDLADEAERSYDRLNSAYNELKERYRKCCR